MIRALIDPNVFISCLLTPDDGTPPNSILEAALLGRFTLLLASSVVEEFVEAVGKKPYLRQRISRNEMAVFVDGLLSIADRARPLTTTPPSVCRDKKDDYLLAHAAIEGVDYLVSGDGDILGLRNSWPVAIVSPAEFARILNDLPDGNG